MSSVAMVTWGGEPPHSSAMVDIKKSAIGGVRGLN